MHERPNNTHEEGIDVDGSISSPHVRAMGLDSFKRGLKRSGMSPEAFVQALTQTALAPLVTWTQADLEALLVTCERHGLDPLGRDVYMVREGDSLTDQAVVVVGVDGWSRILNSHPSYAGMQFKEANELIEGLPAWVECTLHRWDRRVPTRVREYLVEVRGTSQAWLTHPRRMLRHKALVQCARLAFGLVGVYDPDEARRVSDARRAEKLSQRDRSAKTKQGGMGVEGLRAHLACGNLREQ
jgi:phage recombination protein Bet